MKDSDRPAHDDDDDIEATPEMIDAGEWAYVSHDPEHFTMSEIVAAIWIAMAKRKEEAALDDPRLHPKRS